MEPLPMPPPSQEELSPSTSPTTTTPKSIDNKYDEIYAKYSSAIDMGLTKNNELYDHKTTVRTDKIDPPEEINDDDDISYVQSGRGRRYSANTIMRGTNEFLSRDDDTSIHSSPSTQFSLRSNNSQTRMIGSPTQQRNVINSKLEALNAKSLALRNINYTGVYSSYSPTSVMDSQVEGGSVDSRLEYLTKQSMAYRNGITNGYTTSSPASTTSYHQQQGNNSNNKKVTFEADYIYGSQGMRMLDDHATIASSNGYDDQVVVPSSSATVTSSTSLTKSANNNHTGKSSLAMKILSEKILSGYTMSRHHCPKCNMAILSNNEKKKKKSFTFNEDGTLNMDSLRTTTNIEEECVYCPMYKIRSNITKSVCKRIMATKLLSNSGVTTSGSICDNCSSPNLINSQGITLGCEVCPLLDRICVEIVREQSSGRGMKENTICMECGCSGVTSSVSNKCIVCNVLKRELGATVPYSSTAADKSVSSSSLVGASLVPSSSISVTGQSVYMSPQSSTLSTPGGALLIPSLGGGEGAVDQDIAESTSFTSGSTSPGPIDIAKIQEQLNKTIERMNKSGSAPDDIVSLQGQLKDELARAKLSQTALERTLQVPNTSKLSRDELQAELESTKQAQAALEKILVDANKIEKTLSTNQSLKDELLAESYSISQEEVDANGNLKEHIFRYDNIPAVVLVYHIPEQEDCDPSVAAQSHHTKNLKRSERDPVVSNSIFDCCGDAAQPQQQQNFHDYDTIGTDDDEYTLNTVGDDYSRFEMHTSRSVDEGGNNEEKRGSSEKCTPKSNTGRCLFSCFDCGGVDDDAYTMVSKRGIILQPQHQQSPQYGQQSPQYREGSRGDISVGSVSIRKSYFREDSDAYSPVGSEYDESIPASPKNGRPPLPPSLKYSNRFGGVRHTSPTSPTSVISDWSSINEDSAFDSPGRTQPKSSLRPSRYPESPPRSPQFSRFSDTHSVTSELTDFSTRRVKFGQDSRRNQRSRRKQLSVLSEESVGGGSFAAVFKETKDTRCGIGMSNTKNGMLVISRIEEDGLFAHTNLQVGMKVNYINGECMQGRTCQEAAQLIREKEGQVTINSEDTPRLEVESVAIDSVYSADTDVLLSQLESVTSGQRQGLYSSDRL